MALSDFRFDEEIGQYRLRGRKRPLRKSSTSKIDNSVRVRVLKIIQDSTRRMKRGEISLIDWNKQVRGFMISFCNCVASATYGVPYENGRFTSQVTEAQAEEHRLRHESAQIKVDDLMRDIQAGKFGPNFEFGNFNARIHDLLNIW